MSVEGYASDGGGLTRLEFFRDGNVSLGLGTVFPYGWKVTWDTTAVTPGSHTLTFKATDTAGNVGISPPVTVTVLDSLHPTVAITSPANGAAVSHNTSITIAASATDTVGMTKVEFYVGTTLTCTDTTSPYTCSWKVPKTTGVTYSLQAKAYNTRGNTATSTVVSVTAH